MCEWNKIINIEHDAFMMLLISQYKKQYGLNFNILIKLRTLRIIKLQITKSLIANMTDNKGMQLIDKLTRHHIFNCRYWKQECFALNAETFIDKAIKIKYIGGLYSGSKKPTKFLCLVFKLLQMNLPKQIAVEYLKARDYKYLNAMALLYLRIILRGPDAFETLEPFFNDNRKLRIRNMIGEFSIIYVDEFIDNLMRQQTFMGISLPFLPKRAALEESQALEPRVSLLEQEEQQNRQELQNIEEEEEQNQN